MDNRVIKRIRLLAAVPALGLACGMLGMSATPAGAATAHATGTATAPAVAGAAPEVNSAQETVAPDVHSDTLCSSSLNACEEVVNYARGSNYVYYVEVWDNNDPTFNGTYRLLVNGGVRYAANSNGAHVFNLDYYVNSGYCIQGGIIGLSDARTPCWNAP